MGALHFLNHQFLLADSAAQGTSHELELFEKGGQLYLRLRVGNTGLDQDAVCCRVTLAQAKELADAAVGFAQRLSL